MIPDLQREQEQIHDSQEELSVLEGELERMDVDMKQIIRYSHMKKLTQELVDTFIERVDVYKDKRVEINGSFGKVHKIHSLFQLDMLR